MPQRNPNWYTRNESILYPVSDEATGLDDAGARMPSRFVSDLSMYFPSSLGRRAYIGSMVITKSLASLTFMVTDEGATAVTARPLAAITLEKPFDAHRNYPITPLTPNVGGWVVFSPAAADRSDSAEEYEGRFSTPQQSLLLPSTAHAFAEGPVPTLGKFGVEEQLSGLLDLVAGTDLEIVADCMAVPIEYPETGKALCDAENSQLRDVIAIRLKDTGTGANQNNVFEEYVGACGGRPESGSCEGPPPIERLGGVPPDCCGNISIVFKGCARLTQIIEWINRIDSPNTSLASCGVLISCDIDLEEACVAVDRLPDAEGNLPNDFDDLCVSVSSTSLSLEVAEPAAISLGVGSPAAASWSKETPSDPWLLVEGDFDASLGSTDPEGISGGSMRNIVIYPGTSGVPATISAVFKLKPGKPGMLHNAGVVTDYRFRGDLESGGSKYSYFVAEVDYDGVLEGYQCLRIGYFDGFSFKTLAAVPIANTFQLDTEYTISLTTGIDGSLIASAPGLGVTTPSVISPYLAGLGASGMSTLRAETEFSSFSVG